ncbi:MAG: tetratricopeptide repeat protein [Planctomycetes bacterium]|nr:tetratricopeptide repeat protein [Planctomycetota bacterium]
MRITLLLEVADQLWGGVKVALEDANWLARRGHQVTVVSRSGPPAWMPLECAFRRVPDFRAEHLPDGDVVIGTFWTTVPWAAAAGDDKGVPVHLCQGYEGDNPENAALRDRIESVYRLPGIHRLTISPHLTRLLRERFAQDPTELRYVIDHGVHRPAHPKKPGTPLRVGLVGPYRIPWKDLPTGYEACSLAHKAGQQVVLVRASNTAPAPEEQGLPFPVEWHQQLRPDQMGDFYRSLDVFLGTSSGPEEGFFLPAIEAMACGVPSVLTDIPCFRNHQALVGHERYALWVPPRDPVAMAEAMVLAGALPDVRVTLRAAGIEVAGHYHIDRHGEQLEAALRRFAATRPAPPPSACVPVPEAASAPAPIAIVREQPANDQRSDLRLLPQLADEPLAQLCTQLRSVGEGLLGSDPQRAARAFAAAHTLNPDDDTLAHQTATAWLCAGQPRSALDVYAALAAHGVDDEALHVGRGNALHALGDMREAAQAFRAALAVGGRSADAYNRLGVVLFQAGDVTAARQSFERALVLDPKHVDARANLGALPAA